MRLKLATFMLLLAAAANCPKATGQTFYDGTFDPASWTTIQILGTGGQSFSQELTGGNTGEYFLAETTINTPVTYVHLNSSFVFDPGTGPIDSIDFSFDVQNFFTFGGGMGFGLTLEQSGNIYFGPAQISSPAGTNQWFNFTLTGLDESQFTLQTGSGALDFGSAGDPITFGFQTGNFAGLGITTGYDNYTVDVNSIPEPATSTLLVGAFCLMTLARRRVGR